MNRLSGITAALVLFALGAPMAQAAVIYDFIETGGNVVGTLSGSLDVTGLTFALASKSASGIQPNGPHLLSGPDGLYIAEGALGAFSTSPKFGVGGFTYATGTTGDLFAVSLTSLFLPNGYVSGTALSSSLTFTGATFDSLGITPGSYFYTLPNDTVTLKFRTTPEPPELALLGIGLIGFGVFQHKKKN